MHLVPTRRGFPADCFALFPQAAEELEEQFASELQQLKSAAEEKHHEVRMVSLECKLLGFFLTHAVTKGGQGGWH